MITQFQTIMSDPPWDYSGGGPVGSKAPGGFNLTGGKTVQVAAPYPTMTLGQLQTLDVQSVAAKNAHLYLWFTNAFAEEAHALAKTWGFKPKTILTWVKVRHADGQPSMKTGFYFRGASEHMLFCVRGSLKTTQTPPRPTAYLLPREPHSVKPQFFYDLAREQSPGPYLEMFARRERPHWERWGNEVQSTIALEAA